MQHPVEIKVKDLFTFNYVLYKSVSHTFECGLTITSKFEIDLVIFLQIQIIISIATYSVIVIQFQVSEMNTLRSSYTATAY